MSEQGLRSGELAAAAGVNGQTLRYYERRGLLDEPVRTPGGHRLYPAEAATLLALIKAAQRIGFTLDEVAELVDAGRRRHPTGALKERAVAKLDEIDTKIGHLQTIRDVLAGVVDIPRGLRIGGFRPPRSSLTPRRVFGAHRDRPTSTRFEPVSLLKDVDVGSSRTPLQLARQARTIWQC
ncbi:MerR family transcriptional regulator [Pseudofrankia asymbiotica]|uniref:HTH merR-type domain-containing protein n=1 Tax=Pseudofrankia asymbiotica TaxID=1834516 RepID=A0A1V2IHI2_9ACTN|nr:MerR family transcriptional regulator [Pseudofrankia asymbiotica]ONH32638.1 hypothetical protein BL253_04860 [Pseudofrankia asymbiotica]